MRDIQLLTGNRKSYSTAVLPYVQHILLGAPLSKNYNDLSAYGGAMPTAYPWATAVPTPAASSS